MPVAFVRIPFQFDHIISEQHGGLAIFSNLAFSCLPCNKRKGPNIAGRDTKTGQLVPLFHPRRHKWQRHFRWNGAILVGRTPIGRATIRALGINLPYYIEVRRTLIEEGVFPLED